MYEWCHGAKRGKLVKWRVKATREALARNRREREFEIENWRLYPLSISHFTLYALEVNSMSRVGGVDMNLVEVLGLEGA